MAERRKEPRYMCSELVNILITYRDQAWEAIANLEDISRSGACVQLDQAVQIGSVIEILCSSCSFKGTVRNCRGAGDQYDIGVAFDKPNAWDASRYEPAHLLPIATGRREGAKTDAGVGANGRQMRTMRAGASPE